MAAQRRIGVAYRYPRVPIRHMRPPSGADQTERDALPGWGEAAARQLGDEGLTPLLDDQFDELTCEPRILVRLANQR